MVMKISIIGAVVIACVLFFFLKKSNAQPELISVNNSYIPSIKLDLGEIFSGQRSIQDVYFKNHGDQTVLLGARVDCGCTRLAFDPSYIDPLDTAKCTVGYYSNLQPEVLGEVQKKFVIVNKSNQRDYEIIARGTLDIFVKPSLVFEPESLAWSMDESQNAIVKTIRVKNVMKHPVSLSLLSAHNNDGLHLDVLPSDQEIESGHSATFDVAIVDAPDMKSRTLALNLVFMGSLPDQSDAETMRFAIPVSISPRRSIMMIPGAITFSMDDIKDGASRYIYLRSPDDTKVEVTEIRHSNDQLLVTESGEDNRYEIRFAGSPEKRIAYESVVFVCQFEGKEQLVELSVAAFGNAP